MASEPMSNWGRWGGDDERGTLNLITAEHVRKAAGLVQRGKVYSLAIPLEATGPIATGRSPLWHRTTVNQRLQPPWGSADDLMLMHTHGTTHIDALCHIFAEDLMYNGYRVSQSINPTGGARRNGVQNIGSLFGRGVLLDVAGFRGVDHLDRRDEIGPAELDDCARAQGIEPRPGDIVLVRTGWIRIFGEDRALYDSGAPGPNGEVAAWFQRHDLCALGADTVAVEPFPPSTGGALPLHIDVIRNLGGYLIEFLNLEELAANRVYEFLFVAAPLRLVNGIGSPLNPLALC